jgi:hypothetical protein
MKLIWTHWNTQAHEDLAQTLNAIYMVLDVRESSGVVKVYAMNPHAPLCPINKDRAMRYAEVESIEDAKDLAQEWESAFQSAVVEASRQSRKLAWIPSSPSSLQPEDDGFIE